MNLQCAGACLEQVHVDLVIGHECRPAFGDLVFLSDPPPQVGVDEIRFLHRFDRVFGDASAFRRTRCSSPAPSLAIRREPGISSARRG